MQITEPIEAPQTVKLRKTKRPEKKEIEETVVPKVLLRSRIIRIEFPPEIRHPEITELVTKKGVGDLARAEEEEEKIKLKKIKKIKTSKHTELELEKLEMPEFDADKPQVQDIPEEKGTYQRKPKDKVEEVHEEKTIKLGKGKVKIEEAEEETVKLKKTPRKQKEETSEETDAVKKPKQKPETVDVEAKQRHIEKPTFEPTDIPDVTVEIEEYQRPSPEPVEPEEETPKKKKRQKKPKEPEEPEKLERPLVMGKGKTSDEVPEDDVKFRIPSSKKPEDEPEQIKLKPISKPTREPTDTENEADREMGLPTFAEKPDEPEVEGITLETLSLIHI